MHTTASSLVAIAQYFWRIRTSVLYGNQQKINIEAVNDYPPIGCEIPFKRKFPIHRSLIFIHHNNDVTQKRSVFEFSSRGHHRMAVVHLPI